MATIRAVRFVWTSHARLRERERVDSGVQLPEVGSFIRLLRLGIRDGYERWVYLNDRCFIYGLIFRSDAYDVFLIRTVIPRPHSLWNAPDNVALYQLETINEPIISSRR